MTNVLNIDKIPSEFIGDFLGKATTCFLGKAAGSEKFYVNIDKIQPNAKSAKYHSHSKLSVRRRTPSRQNHSNAVEYKYIILLQ